MALPAHWRNNFDLVRLAAASQVVWVHAVAHLALPVPAWLMPFETLLRAFPGVPAFFVVSGYLIADAWLRDSDPGRYAMNRALRVYPALWACFAGSLLLVFSFGFGPAMLADPARFAGWIAAQLTVLQPYNLPALRGFGVGVLNGSLWTIPVELQFYAVLPLLLALPRRALPAVGIASALLYAIIEGSRPLPQINRVVLLTVAPHLFGFLLGVGARLMRERILPLFAGRLPLFLAAHIAAFLLLPDTAWAATLTRPLLAGVVLSAAFTMPGLAGRSLRGHDISYGLYLWHMVVINALAQLGLVGAWRFGALAAGIAVLLAALSWRFVERPALSLKRRAVPRAVPQAG
jgi:peptidoglycan/LPS O-acetylase OafA/YrhL